MFFPNPWFGWIFYFLLIGCLSVAAYFDLRYLTLPKPLNFTILALGVSLNVVRGLWFGIEADEWLEGLAYGLSDSLLGFLFGFVLFFIMWFLGLSGGGDLKLFAAIGAWLGCYLVFWVWIGSNVGFILIGVGVRLYFAFTKKKPAERVQATAFRGKQKGTGPKVPYAFPLALAATIVLLWFFRADLGLVDGP